MLQLDDKVCDTYGNQSMDDVHRCAIGLHLAACDKNPTIWLN